MGMFRSETMKHGTLVLPADRARDFIELLGTKAHLQFMDMNSSSMNRPYRRYIQRIEEMERILRFLFDEINKLPGTKVISGGVDSLLEVENGYQMDKVEEALQKLYVQFQKFRDNNSDLVSQKNAAIEEKSVAQEAMSSLSPASSRGVNSANSDGTNPTGPEGQNLMGFSNVAGVLLTSDQEKFARTIFRATRGNAFTHFENIEHEFLDLKENKPVRKSVFVTYFQAGSQSALKEKILRICQAYGVSSYDWPQSSSEANDRVKQLDEIIEDKTKALDAFEHFFTTESSALLEVHREGGASLIEDYRLFCLKEKAIYATLNMFDGLDATLRADCWYPEAEEEQIRGLLLSHSTPSQVSAFLLTDKHKLKEMPPTYIRTTEFTEVFQSFVDTYGVPRYKEANPALLTIVTFPFLFGIMYGDIGHGTCIFAFGLFLTLAWNKIKDIKDEMVQMVAGGRYMILMMGAFAIYAGFLYNDFFSLGLDLFGTRYELDYIDGKTHYMKFKGDPYPFGLDPAWKGANNELLFFNSFKMKFAVIVGFVQMTTGICMKGLNAIYFRDLLSFIFEFIPQLTFMVSLVGFMDFMIVYKWATAIIPNFFKMNDNKPLIINNIIEMCMFQESEQIAFKIQPTVMKVCMVLMMVSVPLMLLPKPLILKCKHGKKSKGHAKIADQVESMEGGGQIARIEEDEEEEFDFGEEMILQMIETIEFVLGAISNTASYLRLWALSLAHQQLSLVFFNMTVKLVLGMDMSAIVIGLLLFVIFALFAGITFGIMLCMDTLECFLHALRLQWVEFQNKFFKGDGVPFLPLNFKKVLTAFEY